MASSDSFCFYVDIAHLKLAKHEDTEIFVDPTIKEAEKSSSVQKTNTT